MVDGSPLGRTLFKEIPDRGECIVPTIVQLDATAQAQGAELLTCDAHFAKLPAVLYFKKAPG